MPSGYFSYVRVSTVRQGQTGTSLTEQREAIRRYAERWGLSISEEFAEQETAAKRGRPVFARMLSSLKARRASGVIMHKIDRSARNLKDWADLGELIDGGVEVHFANESLDLHSRGGRLSADIQAVVAADYIRNLREETKKGFYGRLKQGLYPMPAPLGYVDCGQGQPKAPDTVRAPLVKQAFELYATGKWGIVPLAEKMYDLGLRTKTGGKVSKNTLCDLLHNPFYTGIIRLKTSGEMYPGKHEPLISQFLFDRAQAVARGKYAAPRHQHPFLFRRHVICARCTATLIGERHKGHVYYRCQVRECPQKTLREEIVETPFIALLQELRFSEGEMEHLHRETKKLYRRGAQARAARRKSLTLELEHCRTRLSKLTDAYLDGLVEQAIYVEKKNRLLREEQAAKERLENLSSVDDSTERRTAEFLELVNNAYLSYKSALFPEKCELVKIITSNFIAEGKTVLPKPRLPFQLVLERHKSMSGGAYRDRNRTLSLLASQLSNYFVSRKDKDGSPFVQLIGGSRLD
jgi:site-specific DNA recombinase